MLVVFALSSQV